MNKDVSFVLDTKAAAKIIGDMAMPIVTNSATAISERAQRMASSISSEPLKFNVSTSIGTIRRGQRAIGKISVLTANKHQSYIANTVLKKAKDAGRIN